MCLVLKDGHTARDGASCFVNPLTALSMIETMRMEGHTALVHTAAASNLGQMLNRICQADGVELVNVVRKPEQAELLRGMGAKHIVDSCSESFMADLTDAIHATGATLAFDATGGGNLASNILTAMEGAAARTPGAYSIYGSVQHKQVYLYGGLDTSPTVLSRGYGMAWGVGAGCSPISSPRRATRSRCGCATGSRRSSRPPLPAIIPTSCRWKRRCRPISLRAIMPRRRERSS